MTDPTMQEPTYLVLTALAEEPMHGYAIMRSVEEASRGRVRLRTGTLYAALDRLADEGLVRVASTEVVEGRRRRTYALTDAGAGRLEAESERLAENLRRARAALRLRSATA